MAGSPLTPGGIDCQVLWLLFLYSEFFIMSQVTITQCLTVVSSAMTTTVTAMMTLISTELAEALGQHNVALPPALIPRDTIRGVAGLTSELFQQPQS